MRFIFEIIRKILARVNYFLLIWKLIFSTAFKKIKYREKFKFLLITPEHCNLGDHAIAAAEEALFKDFFLFEITERSLDKFFKYFRHSLSLKLLFGKHTDSRRRIYRHHLAVLRYPDAANHRTSSAQQDNTSAQHDFLLRRRRGQEVARRCPKGL